MNASVLVTYVFGVVLMLGATVGIPLLLLWISMRGRHEFGPRFLGVCWRLARKRHVPVGQVRLLAAIAIILSGIVPGLLVYILLAVFMEQWAGPAETVVPGPASLPLADLTPTRPVAAPARPVAGSARPVAGPGRIGRYRIAGAIGQGGMGMVYRGRDEALERDVAIKVIHDRFDGVENVIRRFGEEARAVARLSSPHIVQVYEFDPLATPPFLAMELVRGPSVQTLIRHRGRAAVGTAADCARQVLLGLATAHAAGIIHRDVKPANILRADDGTYKLTDFGLARSLEQGQSLTATGSIIGTLHYMAPEVATGHEATAASDLYSLGATLYAMLAGAAPYPDDSPLKLLRRIAAEAPAPIAAHRDDVPPAFEAWLGKLLARDPADRFPSAAAALDALRQLEIRVVESDDFVTVHVEADGADAVSPTAPTPRLDAESPEPIHRDQVDSIIRAAMRLEAQGRSLLGDGTVLEIARELNVDSRFVRRALADHRAANAPPLPPPPNVAAAAAPAPLDPATRLACADAIDRLWWANLVQMGPGIPILGIDICALIGLGMKRPILSGPLAAASERFRNASAYVTPIFVALLIFSVATLARFVAVPFFQFNVPVFAMILGAVAIFVIITAIVALVLGLILWWHELSGAAELCIASGRPDAAGSVRRRRNWGLVLFPFLCLVTWIITAHREATVVDRAIGELATLPLWWLCGWLFTLRPLAAAGRAVRGAAGSVPCRSPLPEMP